MNHSAGDTVRMVLRGMGQLLITAGVIVLLFVVYELKITSLYTDHEQHLLDKTLVKEWADPATVVAPHGGPIGPAVPAYADGTGFARLYFPTLGADEVHVVVEGVSHEDLKKGPGHYPGTQLPGQVGNMVISGHRTTYGAPFNRLDELKKGDAIVVETRTFFYTYSVERIFVVDPTDVAVTYPVPDHPGVAPTLKLLTLTTCNPKYSAAQRLVVRAVLTATLAKGPGVIPPALGHV